MTKEIVLRTFMSIIILSILCLEPTWIVIAQDCEECDGKGTPTPAGNAEYAWPCKCTGKTPTIYDNDADNLIPSAGSVNLWVNSGGLACPPYTWTVSGTGWSLNKSTTENDLEQVTLSLINTTGKKCGTNYTPYATVTVTDACGKTDDIVMRYSGGKWNLIASAVSAFSKAKTECWVSSPPPPCNLNGNTIFDVISGYKRWKYTWGSDSNGGMRPTNMLSKWVNGSIALTCRDRRWTGAYSDATCVPPFELPPSPYDTPLGAIASVCGTANCFYDGNPCLQFCEDVNIDYVSYYEWICP